MDTDQAKDQPNNTEQPPKVVLEDENGSTSSHETQKAANQMKHLSIETDGTNTLHFRKLTKPNSHNEHKSPISFIGHQQFSFNRLPSHAPSIYSIHHTDHDHLIPPASTRHEKSKHSRRYFATVFAIIYAIFLVIFALVAFIGDAFVSQYPLAQAYCICMISIGFIYFIFLYIDIRLHVRKAKIAIKERQRRQQLFEDYLERVNAADLNGPNDLNDINLNVYTDAEYYAIHALKLEPVKPVSHRYCFMTGRHGEFMYLKLGAAWFAFGLLIHSVLLIVYQVVFLTANDYTFYKCASVITLALEVLFPTYSLFVLFFIFKYINVIINEYRGVARFFLMHAIGTSLAMWIHTIVRETAGAIAIAQRYEDGQPTNPDFECFGPDEMNYVHRTVSPYLYPFIIEFNILIVGIWYMIWANISHCPKKLSAPGHGHNHTNETLKHSDENNNQHSIENGHAKPNGHANSPLSTPSETEHCGTTTEHDYQYKSNSVVYADCNSSNRGLFAGLVALVITIVFIILFHITVSFEYYLYTGVLVNSIFYCVLLGIMIIATVFAYLQIIKLDVNHHPMSKLDDVLLFIAIPAFFLETIFSMVPAIENGSILNIFIIFFQLIQVIIQTPFIIDGLRRCCNDAHLRQTKPGRELVTFLIITNVALWAFYTFSVKTEYIADERYDFYGYVLWNILNHISLPLIMFYRFHASVCLVDMWRHAYEPAPNDH
ncbi:Proton channel OtopLc [Pseudolycoriella hygida]|uniref:Proton channel OtopLc n=1 Tax=Pseudolycoriella hygida TaxID=35572 RepID=A0A9Q0RXH1_9DIPT|nr:Proton channel OtopLc [Pseudolycoriella hygida]